MSAMSDLAEQCAIYAQAIMQRDTEITTLRAQLEAARETVRVACMVELHKKVVATANSRATANAGLLCIDLLRHLDLSALAGKDGAK